MDIKAGKDHRLDRHSGSGVSGSPKKGGGGGKGTWGKGGIDDLVTVRASSKDPNYNSDEEEEDEKVVMKGVEMVSPSEAILKEFFMEADIEETARKIKEVDGGISQVDFVRSAMVLAMEKKPFERELISKLLSALYGKAFTSEQIADGFQSALDKLEDTVLDIPAAGEMLAKFIARGIVDEIIPPAFLKNARADSPISGEALALANGLVTDSHRSRKLEHIWGPGDLVSVKRMKGEVTRLIREYLLTGDKLEADRCVRKLNAPSFHFQVVKEAVEMSLSALTEDDRKKILELLAFLHKEGLIVPDHMSHGFKNCGDSLGDLKLDIPQAPSIFEDIVKKAQKEGWLSVDYQ